mgnify:CR=1 FL=1
MRILHTSDWHLGRTFHGRVLDDAHAVFADHLVELARAEAVDAVVVSGDVYDRAIPPTDSVRLLDETLRRLSDITRVILTPGNHDSARRLGFASDLLREGLTIRARIADVDRPVIVPGPDGGDGLYVYALPYLDPDAARETLPPLLADRLGEEMADAARTADPDADPDAARTAPEGAGGHSEKAAGDPPGTASDAATRRLPRSHEAVVSGALRLVAADLAARRAAAPARVPALVMSHAFVVGGLPSEESERDIRVGGVDSVPSGVFASLGGSPSARECGGLDYVALGHLHRPQEIRSAGGAGRPNGPGKASGTGGPDHSSRSGGTGGPEAGESDGPGESGPPQRDSRPGPRLVYSGSPLALSFSEAPFPKSSVLVALGPDGVASLERVPAPVPHRIETVTGTMDELLSPAWDHAAGAWVRAVVRGPMPLGATSRLRERFGQVLAIVREEDEEAPRERIVVTRAADPLEVSAQFLAEVAERAPSPAERAVLARAYEAVLASHGGE